MIIVLREISLVITLYSLSIGYQLAIYLFIQYRKRRDFNLIYNKLLISYCCFALFGLGAYLVESIREFYLKDAFLSEIAYRLGLALFLVADFLFITTAMKPFSTSEESQLRTKKVLGISIIGAEILLFFVDFKSPFFYILIFIGILGSIWVLYFQLKLIPLTSPKSRKSYLIFTGGIYLYLGPVLIINVFLGNESNSPFFLFWSVLVLAGISICFLCIYNFPNFFEFGWKLYLKSLYIIDNKDLRILFYFDFLDDFISDTEGYDLQNLEMYNKKELFSKGLSGIDQVIAELSRSRGEKIKKIKQAENYLLLEYGDDLFSNLTFVLLVSNDLISLRFLLKDIKEKFQNTYHVFLKNLDIIQGNEERLFVNFKKSLMSIINRRGIKS